MRTVYTTRTTTTGPRISPGSSVRGGPSRSTRSAPAPVPSPQNPGTRTTSSSGPDAPHDQGPAPPSRGRQNPGTRTTSSAGPDAPHDQGPAPPSRSTPPRRPDTETAV